MNEAGWKPMPVLLKIIWVLTLLGALLTLLVIFSVYNSGLEIFGVQVYGMTAVNIEFFLDIVFPVILLVAMIKRSWWAWILGLIYYAFCTVNHVFGLVDFRQKLDMTLSEMQHLPQIQGMSDDDIYRLIYWSAFAGVLFNLVFNAAVAVIFFIKRKYFALNREKPESF